MVSLEHSDHNVAHKSRGSLSPLTFQGLSGADAPLVLTGPDARVRILGRKGSRDVSSQPSGSPEQWRGLPKDPPPGRCPEVDSVYGVPRATVAKQHRL